MKPLWHGGMASASPVGRPGNHRPSPAFVVASRGLSSYPCTAPGSREGGSGVCTPRGRPLRRVSLPALFLILKPMRLSISKTKNVGIRPRTDATSVRVRLPPTAITSLDAWIAAQPEPRPSRPEAIRLALREWLAAQPDAVTPELPAGRTPLLRRRLDLLRRGEG